MREMSLGPLSFLSAIAFKRPRMHKGSMDDGVMDDTVQ